jgi:hypothetical protein
VHSGATGEERWSMQPCKLLALRELHSSNEPLSLRAGPVSQRRGHGDTPVCPPWGPLHMGTTPGPLPSLAGKTPPATAGKALSASKRASPQGAQFDAQGAQVLTHGQRSAPSLGGTNSSGELEAVLANNAIPQRFALTLPRCRADQVPTSRMNRLLGLEPIVADASQRPRDDHPILVGRDRERVRYRHPACPTQTSRLE